MQYLILIRGMCYRREYVWKLLFEAFDQVAVFGRSSSANDGIYDVQAWKLELRPALLQKLLNAIHYILIEL